MWIITYKGTPASFSVLCEAESRELTHLEPSEREALIASMSRHGAIATYLHHFGFSWRERPKGVAAEKVALAKVDNGSKRGKAPFRKHR